MGAWVADERCICIIYNKRGCPTIGLRRELEPDVPVELLADQIAGSELGEPLGSLWDEVVVDDNGVHWFTGDHPGWRVFWAVRPIRSQVCGREVADCVPPGAAQADAAPVEHPVMVAAG